MSILKFLWFRHAPPINPRNLCYGASDIAVDLSDIPAFKKQIAHIPFGATWCTSDSNRSYLTTSKMARLHGDHKNIILNVESAFIEQSFGQWVGLTPEEIKKKPEFSLYIQDPENVAVPDGESLGGLFRRVVPAIYKMVDQHPQGGTIVAGAHGGTIRAAVSEATGIPMKQMLKMSVDPLSLTVITFDFDKKVHGKHPWTLESMNLKP